MGSAAKRASLATILIVEDEFLARALLSDHLQGCGFMAFEATNADEAISTIEGGIPIDLLSLAISRKFVDVRDFGSGCLRVVA